MSLRVSCPLCSAEVGEPCTTRTGKPCRCPHRARWVHYCRRMRSDEFLVRLIKDEPRFGLLKGDVLRCVDYAYDAKVTVLYRETDSYAPNCNQYWHDVRFLRFVDGGAA